MLKAYREGYDVDTLYDNPYWKNYPKDDCTIEEQYAARIFVDGHAQKAIDEGYGNQSN